MFITLAANGHIKNVISDMVFIPKQVITSEFVWMFKGWGSHNLQRGQESATRLVHFNYYTVVGDFSWYNPINKIVVWNIL